MDYIAAGIVASIIIIFIVYVFILDYQRQQEFESHKSKLTVASPTSTLVNNKK